jgi:hypothetical protein
MVGEKRSVVQVYAHSDVAAKMLVERNQYFVSGQYAPRALGQARRTELVKGQHPFAVVISCSDSRVPHIIQVNDLKILSEKYYLDSGNV